MLVSARSVIKLAKHDSGAGCLSIDNAVGASLYSDDHNFFFANFSAQLLKLK